MNDFPESSAPHSPSGGHEWSRRTFAKTGLAAAGAGLPLCAASGTSGGTPALAFFLVADTDYEAPADTPDQLDSHIFDLNRRAIDLLNELPGQKLPAEMGGAEIASVAGGIHIGDMIETGDKGSGDLSVRRQATEWKAYVGEHGLSGNDGRLKHPVHEVHGDHDSVEGEELVVREITSPGTREGWEKGSAKWSGQWKIPIKGEI